MNAISSLLTFLVCATLLAACKTAAVAEDTNTTPASLESAPQALSVPPAERCGSDTDRLRVLYTEGGNFLTAGDAAGAIRAFNTLDDEFACSAVPEIQDIVVEALNNKAYVQLELDSDVAGALTTLDDIIARYCQAPATVARLEGCVSTMANSVESHLIQGNTARALEIAHALQSSATDEKSRVLPFLIWLADPKTSTKPVLDGIAATSPEVEFNWRFAAIRKFYLPKLLKKQRNQAECFLTFYEQNHDERTLGQCLKRVK